jgi:hypothetical protein
MNKTVVAVGLVVVVGIAIAASSLRRHDSAPSAPDRVLPRSSEAASRATMPSEVSPAESPAAPPTATTAVVPTPSDDPVTGDRVYPQLPTQLSTTPETPEVDSESADGKSIAPALAAVQERLGKLLKDAGPEGAAIVAALPGARAAIERSLNDPDPAVRAQASALLETLSAQPR